MRVRVSANDGEKLLVTEKMHALEADCRLVTVLHGSYMRTQGLKMIARVRAIT